MNDFIVQGYDDSLITIKKKEAISFKITKLIVKKN